VTIPEIYESLKGRSRVINGELTIPGFTDEDYEELYYTLLEMLAPYIGNNYEYWYTKWARAYHRQKALSRHTVDFYDPQYEKPVHDQTIREQLATIKFFVTRRTYSRYARK
jgi:hypothetical protein